MNPGSRLGKPQRDFENPSVSFNDKRNEFIEYLQVNGYYKAAIDDAIRYLDKYAITLHEPQDVINLFSKVKRPKRQVILAVRLLNFYQVCGYDKSYLDRLRNAIPRVKCGIDLKIFSETKIVESLGKLKDAPIKYVALYNLLLDSGLRLIESVNLINKFKAAEQEKGFYRCMVGEFRGNKQAYYEHFSEHSLNLIKQVHEELYPRTSSHCFVKAGYVTPKYVRKFCFDKMIELEVPKCVADFIQGRVPQRVGAKHYIALAKQASKYYPRYIDYVENLRRVT